MILIRPYQQSDAAALARLWLESWRSTPVEVSRTTHVGDLCERIDRELRGGWTVYVAKNGNALVGFVAIKKEENQLDQLFVHPASQSRGIGKLLLGRAKEEMPKGFWLSTALINIRAQKFYEREGFTVAEEYSHPRLGHQMRRYVWGPDLKT